MKTKHTTIYLNGGATVLKALAVDGLAYHKGVHAYAAYAITHIASGLRVTSAATAAEARLKIDAIRGLIDWTTDKPVGPDGTLATLYELLKPALAEAEAKARAARARPTRRSA